MEIIFLKINSSIIMKYPRKLSAGANNTVIVISETEVGKLFLGDTRSEIGSEAEKMQFANGINNLVVKFFRLDFNESIQAEMLVMERIHPIDYRAYEVEIRELWLDVFEDELNALHNNGFVHRDLKRPSNIGGLSFDNILRSDFKNAIRPASSARDIACSSPSGISDVPEAVSVATLARSTGSSVPKAVRSVSPFSVSAAIQPVSVRPSRVSTVTA